MAITKKELRIYCTKEGREPFIDWLESLKSAVTRAHITMRLNRVILGNYGDYKRVSEGVYELRIHYGSGYRIYFSEWGRIFLLLLIGGSKRTQEKDIQKAKKYLNDLKEREYDET